MLLSARYRLRKQLVGGRIAARGPEYRDAESGLQFESQEQDAAVLRTFLFGWCRLWLTYSVMQPGGEN